MNLSSQQRKKLQKALIDAFPTKSSLEQFVSLELDKHLDVIAGGMSLQEIIFNLIKVADSQGWIEDLVRQAHEYNPGNLQLKAIAEELLKNRVVTVPPAALPELSTQLKSQAGKVLASDAESVTAKRIEFPNILSNSMSILKQTKLFVGLAIVASVVLTSHSLITSKSQPLELPKNSESYRDSSPNNINDGKILYENARTKYSTKDYNGAINELDKAIELGYKKAKAYSLRGRAHLNLKKLQLALEDLTEAIIINNNSNPKDSNNRFPYCWRGHVYKELGDDDPAQYEAAINDFTI